MSQTPPALPQPPLSPGTSLRQLLDSLNREQRRNQELLASLGFVLRSFTNLSRLLELVPLVAARLVEADGALLVSFHEDGRLWREQVHAAPLEHSADLVRRLAALPEADLQVVAHDDGEAELEQASRLDRQVGSLLGRVELFSTSLVARGRQRGRLYVFSRREGYCWSEVHRRHVQLVADLTAVALENEVLQQDMRRHERVDRQLSIGAEIQAQLVPDRCPVIEGVDLAARCRPAFEVGGDYIDFIPTRPRLLGRRRERGRWAVVVGDVMGKGVPAGLLMTLLRGMLRAGALSGHAPDRILHDLNQLAQEDLSQSHRFVTLFYADFDPLTRLLRYSNAAHNPPLLWRRRLNRVERLDAPGLLIGLQSEADYGLESIVLEPGDVVLFYTDGVTEASSLSGERYEEERLQRSLLVASRAGLEAQGILNQLFGRLDRFVGADRQPQDDASMVVFKVRDEVMLPTLSPGGPGS
ncbi:GAF domain-containing SpoIIE family protein phosphatase [Cyanobium sp. ATX 6A2]|uniref:PP2C family protein-serine/threonine phosphatase n=1 Tax=Cyanobium sp. ATX 6A2 TaxID=2823700 RepID=UPI0020CC4335|nr:GAF domain-containing SpoIIE family protein phosphatase [Cyanobium sp. ATX 6A2]